jgi:3-methyl-2-oxobutanoate hydroxymethyltransferase
MYDILGLFDRFTPKFVKKYANLAEVIVQALEQYKQEVLDGVFPTGEHYHMKDEVLREILGHDHSPTGKTEADGR